MSWCLGLLGVNESLLGIGGGMLLPSGACIPMTLLTYIPLHPVPQEAPQEPLIVNN